MRKFTLFLGFLLILSTSFSQETKLITIDFKEKTIGEIPSIEVGDYYQIEIKNINLNLWKISLNTKDTTLIKSLKTPTFADFNTEILSGLVANLKNVASSSPYSPKTQLEDLYRSANELYSYNIFEEGEKSKNEIKKRLNEEKELLIQLLNDQNLIIQRIDNLSYEVAKKELSSFDNYNIISSDFNIEKALKGIEDIRKDAEELSEKISENKNSYDKFSSKYSDDIKVNKEFTDADKERKDSYGKMIGLISKIRESINAEKSIELLKKTLFVKDKSENFKSLPIQFKEDQAKVFLTIEQMNSDFKLQKYTMPFQFPVSNSKYWALGVSFYGSSLYDENYSVLKNMNEENETYELIKENQSKLEVGISTLLRFGRNMKKNKDIGYHGSFGPGISITQNIRPRILLGGGFSFGSKHRIGLDGGAILGYVDRLSNVYTLNKTYISMPENTTISKLKLGMFLSVGYFFSL